MVGGVGKAIKGFGKALKTAKRNKASKQVFKDVKGKPFPKSTQAHIYKQGVRHKAWKQMGLKGPTYKIGKKTKTGAHNLDEVWTYDKNYKEK
jgi:hypothetical protein